MKKKYGRIIAFILALSCVFSGTAFSANIADSKTELVTDVLSAERCARCYDENNYEQEFAPGQVFLTLKSTASEVEEYTALFPEVDIDYVEVISDKFIVLHLIEKTRDSVIDAIEELKDNEFVKIAEPNYKIYLDEVVVPNDADYNTNNAWHLQIVEADEAWNYSTGSSSVTVGVIDSGVSPVADLAANVDLENGINFLDYTELPIDTYNHGTPVAGIIGAMGNNSIGITGVCWDVTIVPLKIYDTTNTEYYVTGIVEGLIAATAMNLDIVNISYSSLTGDGMLEAIQNYNGLVVVSAGNNNTDLNYNTFYPAALSDECDNVIVVGGSTPYDYRYDLTEQGSNYGDCEVHLFAPGAWVYTTCADGSYKRMTGTSFAAPMVTGAAALVLSYHPDYTTAQVKEAILNSVDQINALADLCITGGRLNVKNALLYTPINCGDLNYDWRISNADVIALGRYLENVLDLTDHQLSLADINGDGMVDETDLYLLAMMVIQG